MLSDQRVKTSQLQKHVRLPSLATSGFSRRYRQKMHEKYEYPNTHDGSDMLRTLTV